MPETQPGMKESTRSLGSDLGEEKFKGAGFAQMTYLWLLCGSAGNRVLISFNETTKGSNVSFDCAPSGPCVACLYSEKASVIIEVKLGGPRGHMLRPSCFILYFGMETCGKQKVGGKSNVSPFQNHLQHII